MKYFITSLCLVVSIFAQNKIELKDLETPPSPAFVLFDIEPNSIERPTTPKEVASSFISAVRQGGSFDVAPYWLTSHPELTFDEYYNANISQTILQTLSVSFAASPISTEEDSLGTLIGLGARWMFVAGNPRDTLEVLRSLLFDIQNKILDTEEPEQIEKLKNEAKEIALAIQNEDHMRIEFRLEMATAVSVNFLGNSFDKGKLDKWGVWMTGAYLLDKPNIDFLGVVRLLGNIRGQETQNVVDVGTRLALLINDFTLSIEFVNRSEINISTDNSENEINGTFYLKSSNRLSGNIKYNYNDDVSVFITFGQGYSTEQNDNGPLIAQVGFNFGLGDTPLLKL